MLMDHEILFGLAKGSYPLMVVHLELDTIKNWLNLAV